MAAAAAAMTASAEGKLRRRGSIGEDSSRLRLDAGRFKTTDLACKPDALFIGRTLLRAGTLPGDQANHHQHVLHTWHRYVSISLLTVCSPEL